MVVVDAAHHHAFFAPVKLERLTQLKLQGYERFGVFACIGAPGTDEVSDAAVATEVAAGLELRKQCACCTSVLFGAQRVCFEGLLQFVRKVPKFVKAFGSNVLGHLYFFWGLLPFVNGVAGQARAF